MAADQDVTLRGAKMIQPSATSHQNLGVSGCFPVDAATTPSRATARAVGRPQGFRAVGMANNRNPIAIVVPCHRVIASDGALCGYGGGLDIKRKLLQLEGALSGTLAA